MNIYARHVSTSEAGDYYGASFALEKDGDETSPYLIIQRQFEDDDGGVCYIETHDENYRGHFRLRRSDFSRTQFRIVIDRAHDNILCVNYRLSESTYAQAAKIVRIITGETDPP